MEQIGCARLADRLRDSLQDFDLLSSATRETSSENRPIRFTKFVIPSTVGSHSTPALRACAHGAPFPGVECPELVEGRSLSLSKDGFSERLSDFLKDRSMFLRYGA